MDIQKIPVFCINLDRRPERYALFSKQRGAAELNIQRVSAVDGSKINPVKSRYLSNQTKINILHKTRRGHGEIDTLGAIGCSLSHYSVWKRFLETDAQHCLVLEDDAQVRTGLVELVKTASVAVPDFDVWLLSYKLYDKTLLCLPTGPSGQRQDQKTWKTPVNFWGTSAYIVSRAGAKRLMEDFFPIECHLDKYMCLKQLLGKLRIIVHETFKTYTLPYGTDIQLNKCSLCNYPDDFKDGILVKKYMLVAPITYGLIITLLFGMTFS
jgi:GR25 family glycosyltransferase involved in LPS biosynthesis